MPEPAQKVAPARAPRFLAVDGGGTKTEMVLFQADGRILKRLNGPSTNASGIGFEASFATLSRMFCELLDVEIPAAAKLHAVFMGLAGGGLAANQPRYRAWLEATFPDVPVRGNGSDAIGALNAGLRRGEGMVLIAGTGSIAYVRTGSRDFQVGGWGHLLGDEGSGYALGRMALTRALQGMDGRRPPSALTERLVSRLGKPLDLALPQLYAEGKCGIAALAPLVFEAAAAADPDAQRILQRGALQLVRLIRAGCLHLDAPPYRVVLSGGLWRAPGNPLHRLVAAHLDARFELICPTLPPLYGCALEALALAGMTPGPAFESHFRRATPSPTCTKESHEPA